MQNLLKNTTELARTVCGIYIEAFQAEKGRVAFAHEDGFCTSDSKNAETAVNADSLGMMSVIAIDATCGNGHDTLWLAELCDRVYAFDIQPEAIEATARLLKGKNIPVCHRTADACSDRSETYATVELICDSHENMRTYVREQAAVIVFNLGYLPSGNKSIATAAESTVKALENSIELLCVNGLLCVTMYQGHSAGKTERAAVLEWAKTLDKSIYHCVHTDMINQPNCPPEILFVTKKKHTAHSTSAKKAEK